MKSGFPWLALGLFLPPLAAAAQPASLPWHRIAGGGGASQPATWQLHGTVGQSLATGGGTGLGAGFWNLIAGAWAAPGGCVLALASSENPAGFKDAVSFTASLTPAGDTADATGTVSFLTNGVAAGAAVEMSLGQATLTLTTLPRGTNIVTAEYSGDSRYLSSAISFEQVVTNHPPLAAVVNVIRPAGLTVKISLTSLATNWSDADGDAVSLTGVAPLTAQGVKVYLINLTTNQDGSYVITNTAYLGYVNASNINDEIAYSLNDGHGGTTQGAVNLLISTNALTGQTTGIVTSGGNAVTLNLAGLPGYTYGVQRSTNLAMWTTIWTTNAPAGGRFSYTDTYGDLGGIAPASAYYRLTWNP